ncbi:response regulator transcription factor [Methylocella tundrae]|uniref:Response regulator MprA n=1 Tax=Methylocella tundrae TaxID=227605 RepID=A0A4U8Z6F2_METTU|nr:response regulator transcription factor [Methylocella tundrae]WPP03043.1 response regulator transcription factor [Methylocella tundrae]VFU16260.1 Response regulator MprA [Methylocella tundrae]
MADLEKVPEVRGREQRPLLLVEDEPAMALEIESELANLGYFVMAVATQAEALEIVHSADPALLIVDRLLSGADCLSMIRTLRAEGNKTPVLFLSALASVDERIRGLKAGGDDYLTKPFAMEELVARVEALLRRSTEAAATTVRLGPLQIDLVTRAAWRGERPLELLPTEFKLLEYFMRRPRQTVTRAMLLEDIWRYRFMPETNVVDVHVGKLRRKMDCAGEPPLIRSVRGAGFILDVQC